MEGAIVPTVSGSEDTSQFPNLDEEDGLEKKTKVKKRNQNRNEDKKKDHGEKTKMHGLEKKTFLDRIKAGPVFVYKGYNDPFESFDDDDYDD